MKRKSKIDPNEIAALERGLKELKSIVKALETEIDADRDSLVESSSSTNQQKHKVQSDSKIVAKTQDSKTGKFQRATGYSPLNYKVFRLPLMAILFITLHCITILLIQNFEVPLPIHQLKLSVCPVATNTQIGFQSDRIKVIDASSSIQSALLCAKLIPSYIEGLIHQFLRTSPTNAIKQQSTKVIVLSIPFLEPLTVSVFVALVVSVYRYLAVVVQKAVAVKASKRNNVKPKTNSESKMNTAVSDESIHKPEVLSVSISKVGLAIPALVLQSMLITVVVIGLLNNIAVMFEMTHGRPLIMC